MKRLIGLLVVAGLCSMNMYAATNKARPLWHQTAYTSATLTGNGNSTILAFADQVNPVFSSHAHYGMSFVIVGANITTDETLDLVLDFYTNAAGTGGSVGTITFNQLTAGSLNDLEAWPGDITAFTIDTPVPPYFKATWTLGGTTKSMNFTLFGSFWRIE